MQEIALKNNGKLISTSWIGSNHKYLFEFKDGRQFSLKASNITKWPKDLDLFLKLSAAHNKTPEERMGELKNIANENNGKVISDKWLGTSKKHILEFSDGRQFKMSLEKLKANGWPKNPDNYLKIIQSKKKIL